MPTPYDNWLDPPDPEEDDIDEDDPLEEIERDPEWARRVENGMTIYEEDFLYDPMRGRE